jgi:hypothetical protein
LCIFIHDQLDRLDQNDKTLSKRKVSQQSILGSARRIVKHGTVPSIYPDAYFPKCFSACGRFAVFDRRAV